MAPFLIGDVDEEAHQLYVEAEGLVFLRGETKGKAEDKRKARGERSQSQTIRTKGHRRPPRRIPAETARHLPRSRRRQMSLSSRSGQSS